MKYFKTTVFLFAVSSLGLPGFALGEASIAEAASESLGEDTSVTTLTPEQIESYRFQIEPDKFVVEDLSVGQRAILASQRRSAKDLIARRLGVVNIRGAKTDLRALQQVVDRKVIRKSQVEEWQSIGILFGDILAKQYKLKWVSYEDDLGANKALRYKDTDNFIFPVTLFSKRVKFDEEIDMYEVYAKLEGQIEDIIEFESRPKLPNS